MEGPGGVPEGVLGSETAAVDGPKVGTIALQWLQIRVKTG
jgi:hypothetical protein